MRQGLSPRSAWLLALAGILAIFATTLGAGLAAAGSSHHESSPSADIDHEYCQFGGPDCNDIGITDAYYDGHQVDLVYTKQNFCKEPPPAKASSHCEVGADAVVSPPPNSGDIESPVWALVPIGFTPPVNTLHCPKPGRCIDHPSTLDLTRVFGSGFGNVPLPAHSHVIEDTEHGISVWWPLRVVGVKSLNAWNMLRQEKSFEAMRSCQSSGQCTPDISTNNFEFFSASEQDEHDN